MDDPLRSFVPALLRWSILMVACAAEATGQTITELAPLYPGGHPVNPVAVNADGSVVVGSVHNGVNNRAFRWTSAGGSQDLGVPPGALKTAGYGVSGDGSLVVGEFDDWQGYFAGSFTWTSAGGMQILSLPGWSYVSVRGVSSDSENLIGSGSNNPSALVPAGFAWNSAGGVQVLDPSDQFGGDSPRAVNDDGSVVVGSYMYSNMSRAFRWSSGGGMQGLGTLPGQIYSEAVDVSADGSVVVGSSETWTGSTGFIFKDACRWNAAGGIQDLGVLPGDAFSYATGVSGDGSIVVGNSYYEAGDGTHARPFLWTPVLGLVDLSAHLTAQGVDLTGWILGNSAGISADGSALVGIGLHNNKPAGWIINGLRDASWSNYGAGFPGTNGVPSFTSQADPVLGTALTLDLGNSSGLATAGMFFIGLQRTTVHSKWGGDLLVMPLVTQPIGLLPGVSSIAGILPADELLCGVAIDLQVLEADPGAAHGVSFTQGLELILGH